jgi:hypothetical protein
LSRAEIFELGWSIKKALLSKRKEARLAKVEQKGFIALDMNFELRPCGSSTPPQAVR